MLTLVVFYVTFRTMLFLRDITHHDILYKYDAI